MIRSRKTFDFYFITGLFLVTLSGLSIFINLAIKEGISSNGLLFAIADLSVLSLFFGQYVFKGGLTTEISAGQIRFRLLSLIVIKTFKREELDGYVTGRINRGRQGRHKIIWLVKDGRMVKRIDEMFTKNLPELENGLKPMKCLGYQRITFLKRLQLLFVKIKIERS